MPNLEEMARTEVEVTNTRRLKVAFAQAFICGVAISYFIYHLCRLFQTMSVFSAVVSAVTRSRLLPN